VIAPETGNVVAFDVKPDEIVTAYSEPAAPTMVPASDVHSAASDEQAVRHKLRSYESYQGAGFRACSVVVSGELATAECRGSITQTAGPESPSSSSEHQWTFKMRRDGGTWKIDEVSRSSPMDAPRAPEHE
jgi:ketosteroid isomerase-like protein